MGKSSPTKWQLKHISDLGLLHAVYLLQSSRTVHLSEIVEVLKPIPEKLIWRKLQKLEDRGWIEGYGPSGTHYRVLDIEEKNDQS